MTLRLRPYQSQALLAESQHRAEHPEETRLAIVMATGLGKGQIIAFRAVGAIENVFFRGRVLILTHTEELVADLAARCKLIAGQSEFPITVGIVKAETDEVDADIVIGSVATLANPARRQKIHDVGLLIVDECHHAVADSYQAIMRHFGCLPKCSCTPYNAGGDGPEEDCPEHGRIGPIPALGFTATLERGDGQGLGQIWQDVCFTRDISWGVRHGYLVQPIGHRLEIDVNFHTPAGTGRDVTAINADAGLMEALAPEKIVEKWLELAKGRPTVAFMPLVRSADALRNAFRKAGIRAETIHGSMPDALRRDVLAAYDLGEIDVICNAMVLTEGWDSPRTKCVIVGRPTKNRGLFVQMAGRGLRPIPGIPVEEQDCLLICVADATTDLCSIADLSDRPIDRKVQGPLTAMEDQWDIGKELDEQEQAKLWTGRVDVREFDPLVARSSKVWKATKHGTPFLPIGKEGQYVFLVGTSVFVREPVTWLRYRTVSLHRNLPDLELALAVAEDEAQERGGDLGRLLADRGRAWRKAVPSEEMKAHAIRLGLEAELAKILADRAGGKAGKLSDLIGIVEATRALEPMVAKIKEVTQ
jgi:superfamily II DNA or RNA helicase